jgi:hypothetical protein
MEAILRFKEPHTKVLVLGIAKTYIADKDDEEIRDYTKWLSVLG